MLSKTYEEYDIVDPEELQEDGDNGEGEGEEEYPKAKDPELSA